MQVRGILVIGMLAVFPQLSMAQSPQSPKVLKGNQITEAALIEALVPRPMTRSLRPSDGPAVPQRPPSQGIMVNFETNSSELTDDGRRKLDIVGRALNTDKLATLNFQLEGHADPRGTAEWNQRLSEERAEAVRQYLVQNQNVSPNRLKSIGKGDREPINTTNPAAMENRRVTIVTNVQ